MTTTVGAQAPWYREWRPPPVLASHVACTWAGKLGTDGSSYTETVLPDGCADIVWDGSRIFVAGPDTGPVPIVGRPGGHFVGIRFRPGLAPTVLGCRADEIRDRRVGLAEVWGGRNAVEVAERLARSRSLAHAASTLARAVELALPAGRDADPLVEAVVRRCREPRARATRLAADLDVSERTLHRRCVAAVGYGPATLARVLRFRRFLALRERFPGAGLAGLAAEAGYADQAHLTRESTRLAGMPPKELVSGSGVRSVQDG